MTNVTDRAPGVAWWDPSLGDRWRYLDLRTSDNRVIKTDLPRYSPFPKTLYLDCDTFVVGSLDRIPVFLNYFDLVLRFVNWPCRVNPGQVVLSEQLRLREVSHFNGGVIGFRKNPATEAFFRTWAERFVRMGLERDQPSLVEACFLSPVHLFPLREEWNQGSSGSEARPTAATSSSGTTSPGAGIGALLTWSAPRSPGSGGTRPPATK